MKLKNYILLTGFLLSLNSAFAQYAEDALRFSQTEAGTTARFRGLGNAQTALGGDLSSLSGNPAGLGMFTRSEINLTADFSNATVNGLYFGQNTESQVDKLGLTQIGGVWHIPAKRVSGSDLNNGWLSTNFGISYNKSNNLNSNIDYRGINPTSSFGDYLADLGNSQLQYGNPYDNLDEALLPGSLERMAWDALLIDYDENANEYFPATDFDNNQRDSRFNSGSQSEVNFALGANYSNRFYVGASLALTSLNYTSDREYNESGRNFDFPGQLPELVGGTYNLSYRSYQNTNGSGVNLKLGMIYRATDNLRIGFNFVSPTWYSIDDSYTEVLDSRYANASGGSAGSYTNNESTYDFNYNLRTPYRVNGGLAVTFGGQGLLTGDVEYVDYSSIHIKAVDNRATEDETNSDIRSNYTSAVNFRVGGEYKVSSAFSLRAGYNTQGNPYKNLDYSNAVISGGFGYRVNNFYIDATYANTTVKYTNRTYPISKNYPSFSLTGAGPVANIKDHRNSVFLTVGTRF